jgi:hypothetical protein
MLPKLIPGCVLMAAEAELGSDTKLLPARLRRVDWIDELLNWITKYEMIIVGLTLVGATVTCGDAPMKQRI